MKKGIVFLLILALAANLCAFGEGNFLSNVLSAVISAGEKTAPSDVDPSVGIISTTAWKKPPPRRAASESILPTWSCA